MRNMEKRYVKVINLINLNNAVKPFAFSLKENQMRNEKIRTTPGITAIRSIYTNLKKFILCCGTYSSSTSFFNTLVVLNVFNCLFLYPSGKIYINLFKIRSCLS